LFSLSEGAVVAPAGRPETLREDKRVATQAQLIEAVKTSGWEITRTAYGFLATHEQILPTPPTIPADWWGSPTHWLLNQVSLVMNGSKVVAAHTTANALPWVNPNQVRVSYQDAIAFIARVNNEAADAGRETPPN
jgi:hypothetical protein